MGKFHLILMVFLVLPFCLGFTLTSNIADTNTSAESLIISWSISNISELYNDAELHLKLDTNSATQTDSSGQENNATVTGATYTSSGYLSSAYSFDGNDFMQTDIKNMSSRTYMAWIKNTKNSQGQIMGYDTYRGDISYDKSINRLYFTLRNVNKYPGTVNLDQNWHHIAVTWQWPNIFFFVDGAYVGNATNAVADIPDQTGWHFYVGARSGTGTFWNGTIDDVRVYDRALTAQEISMIVSEDMLYLPVTCNLSKDSAIVDTVSPYTWDTSTYIEQQFTLNITCSDGLTVESQAKIYKFNFFTDTYLAYKIWRESEKINEVLELIPFIMLWLGLWIFGYYAMQTGNTLLGGTMIILTVPLDLFFSYRFQESLLLGTGFLGIAFGIMTAWTFGVFTLIKRKTGG